MKRESNSQYYQLNKEKIKEYSRKYHFDHKQTILQHKKQKYQEIRQEVKKYNDEYYKINKEKIVTQTKEYYQLNKEKIKLNKHNYYIKNKEKYKAHNKKYYINNKNILKNNNKKYRIVNKKKIGEYYNQRYKNNIQYRLAVLLRSRLYKALRINQKNKLKPVLVLTGCNILKLKQHIESKFQLGMTWNNNRKWHIDHIKPCSAFDLTYLEEQQKCFHYTNLQPLWAGDNLSKGKQLYEKIK